MNLVAEGKLKPVIHATFPLAQAAEAHRVVGSRADITGGATSYFDANGVTHGSVAANTVAGKGWSFVMTFDTTGIADNPPTYAAGVPANGVTCV